MKLLSPVGSPEALMAAVSNGADAVYLGSKLFNARRLANNFTKDELRRAIQYAHMHNVRVYLTLNTLIKNQEMGPFLQQVAIADSYNVDAIIVQDLSFAPIIKQYFPNLSIHASTQSTIMNSAAVKFWSKYVDVFVLARELTREQVRAIYDSTHAHLETFVHGHLCISYSGQCLISSLIGKRSGNRGLCASSCRKQYNGDTYLLSAKDLALLPHLGEVAASGVQTIKLEGRMKPAEYVAVTTRSYREQLDTLAREGKTKVGPAQIRKLKMAFNREFTAGYFHGEKSIVDPLIATNRGLFLGKVRSGVLELQEDLEVNDGVGCINFGKMSGDYVRTIRLNGKSVLIARKGDRVELDVDGFQNGATILLTLKRDGEDVLGKSRLVHFTLSLQVSEGKVPEVVVSCMGREIRTTLVSTAVKATKHPLTAAQLKLEMEKYSGFYCVLDSVTVETDNSFIPKSELTALRGRIEDFILDTFYPSKEKKVVSLPTFDAKVAQRRMIHVRVYSKKAAEEAVSAGADVIYYDVFGSDAVAICRAVQKAGKMFFAYTPMVMVDSDLVRLRKVLAEIKPDGILVNNVGVLGLGLTYPIVLGYQMNIFNDQQLAFYGVPAIASIELNSSELAGFKDKSKLIYYAHGNPVVMTFKEVFSADSLTDEKRYTFRLRKVETGATEMLYSKSIGLLQHTPVILDAGITQLFLDLESDVGELVRLYKEILAGRRVAVGKFTKGVTVGNLEKGVM